LLLLFSFSSSFLHNKLENFLIEHQLKARKSSTTATAAAAAALQFLFQFPSQQIREFSGGAS
jgi:hypothetical protein